MSVELFDRDRVVIEGLQGEMVTCRGFFAEIHKGIEDTGEWLTAINRDVEEALADGDHWASVIKPGDMLYGDAGAYQRAAELEAAATPLIPGETYIVEGWPCILHFNGRYSNMAWFELV